ncbi:MAG TPA: hypothetical protein VES64_04735 [Allosphingosinicella sp.]|nr:hypothetical protein [Allosphingosinicella sp.]
MPAYVKTRTDLENELTDQLSALRDSATAYDAGKLWEAKRLAATAFILLHDGGRRTQSLLTQLGIRRGMTFTSTVKPPEANSPLPLAMINVDVVNGVATYAPFLDGQSTHRNELKFSKWYDERVFETGAGRPLSRKNLIYALRNQMGGGHVDGEIEDEAVHWLTKGVHTVTSDDPWRDEAGNVVEDVPFAKPFQGGSVPNGHLATMRQIGWELDFSLRRAGY